MENKKDYELMLLTVDEESAKRGIKTDEAVVLHVNERGQGLLTAFAYSYGQYIEGEYFEYDSYEKQFTDMGVYKLTPEQVVALKKERPGSEEFKQVLKEIKAGENLADSYDVMSDGAKAIMRDLRTKDSEIAQAALDAQRGKEDVIYQAEYERKEREEMDQHVQQTKIADEKFLDFFIDGKGGR